MGAHYPGGFTRDRTPLSYFRFQMSYLEELNEAQRVAVEHTEGPVMVIAGAGSGKTRVLTYRIVHLIRGGVDPFNILALTFTNKAAREMKARIDRVVGEQEARNIWMGTFHSIFARILRIEADRINYPRDFTIYDTQDSKSLIKDIIKGMGLDDKVYKVNIVYGRISNAKNNLIGPKDYANQTEIVSDDHQAGRPKMAEIYAKYAQRCYRAGAMDFDDLLFKTNELLRDFPDVLLRYQHKFRYILVDEYQDTNFSQYMIVKQLGAAHRNVCVVGDDAQSIYSFRGANIANILNFRKDYPEAETFKLEQNYRSTKVIVNAANSIIARNKDQIQKTVWTDNDQGKAVKVHRAMSDNDEGKFVANTIFEVQNNGQVHPKDFAILYRTNAQSRSFEEQLRKINLPYRIYGGLSFYQRKEIKDLLAYYRLSANPQDEEALKRIINYPARGIGKTTMDKVIVCAAERDTSLWNVINAPTEYGLNINKGTAGKLSDFAVMIRSFGAELATQPAYELGHRVAKESSILKDLYADKSPEGVARYENIQELLAGMKEFSDQTNPDEPERINTLSDFLIDVALLTDQDQDDGDDNKVSLMTIHAAKGLEFPYVFVVGLEENLFPSQMALHSRSELEEERRLFYVALTRAEKQAWLTYALTRYRWGQLQQGEPSRFIEEIDEQYLEMPKVAPSHADPFGSDFQKARQGYFTQQSFRGVDAPKPKSATPKTNAGKPMTKVSQVADSSFQAADAGDIQAGQQVEHARFGRGKVLKVEGEGVQRKATVFFPSTGQKQLLLKFAKLRIV